MQVNRYRLGIDIGGTFTDFTLVDESAGQILVEKVLTTPDQPDRAVFQGIERLQRHAPTLLADAAEVIHATTLLTNVVIERKGARTALFATRGFRDVLEIGRELRYDVYDAYIRFPDPLVARSLRFDITERVLADGSVYRPLDELDVREAIAAIGRAGIESVAICFLHSYRNPVHEKAARELVRRLLPDVQVSISSEVHPEPKEYERTSTTVVDAYVKPIATQYLAQFADRLQQRGYPNPLYVMMSNGGTADIRTAQRFPVQLIESGPAAGVEAVAHYGKLLGIDKLLSFDMGGTTAKLCLMTDGQPARTRTFEVDRVHRFKAGSGTPIATPVYDLLEIGAGGGSIARIDSLGLLQVGPESAGSSPGPACYGVGGEHPTVTDADLILGLLDPDFFLGGAMKLDRDAAVTAMRAKLAEPLGIPVEQAALGIHELVNETMASAARVYIAEKGENARQLAMVAFGGAGPVHAIGLARKLGCPQVIVPPWPGVMSSYGLLAAPISFERARAIAAPLVTVDSAGLAGIVTALEAEAASEMPAHARVEFEHSVEMQLIGQDFPLEIPVDRSWSDPAAIDALIETFHREYVRLYGRTDRKTPLELVSVRVRARHRSPAPPSLTLSKPGARGETRRRKVFMRAGWTDVAVLRRESLAVGTVVDGPAIVEERESTFAIESGDRLVVDDLGCLRVTLARESRPEA
ncbi:MAG: hydantoinase/oxoprolinase family protein [Lautropia sp.]